MLYDSNKAIGYNCRWNLDSYSILCSTQKLLDLGFSPRHESKKSAVARKGTSYSWFLVDVCSCHPNTLLSRSPYSESSWHLSARTQRSRSRRSRSGCLIDILRRDRVCRRCCRALGTHLLTTRIRSECFRHWACNDRIQEPRHTHSLCCRMWMQKELLPYL